MGRGSPSHICVEKGVDSLLTGWYWGNGKGKGKGRGRDKGQGIGGTRLPFELLYM